MAPHVAFARVQSPGIRVAYPVHATAFPLEHIHAEQAAGEVHVFNDLATNKIA